MHRAHELHHLFQRLRRGLDDDVDALPDTLRSKSVTRAATSMRASASRSRPVISQSIHTSRSFTASHPTHASAGARSQGRFRRAA